MCQSGVVVEIVHKDREKVEKKRESKSTLWLPPASGLYVGGACSVSTGFHAVTKAPVRPAYLPCSKTREGVYPAVKVARGLRGIRFRATSGSLFRVCRQGKQPLCCSCCVV